MSTKRATTERAKKFIRELVEQGLIGAFRDNDFEFGEGLRNKHSSVKASTAIDRFDRHFRSPVERRRFKTLFKQVFPL